MSCLEPTLTSSLVEVLGLAFLSGATLMLVVLQIGAVLAPQDRSDTLVLSGKLSSKLLILDSTCSGVLPQGLLLIREALDGDQRCSLFTV